MYMKRMKGNSRHFNRVFISFCFNYRYITRSEEPVVAGLTYATDITIARSTVFK